MLLMSPFSSYFTMNHQNHGISCLIFQNRSFRHFFFRQNCSDLTFQKPPRGVLGDATKNLEQIGTAVLTFIGYIETNHEIYKHNQTCSKYHTFKTLSRTVSVQVQSVCYEYKTGRNPHSYNPVNYQLHYHWAGSHQLSVSIQRLLQDQCLNQDTIQTATIL